MSGEIQQYIDSIETDKVKELVSIGSSLKVCLVAEGHADICPRLGPTVEWDTGAAHALLLGSGMDMLAYENDGLLWSLSYNKEHLINPFICVKK